jgi:hypothetical protein
MITATLEMAQDWKKVEQKMIEIVGKIPDTNGILLLIGIRELGTLKDKFTKEEKVNLMHIAVCKILSFSGYYELKGIDKDGWPHWEIIKKLPTSDVLEQEVLIKYHIIEYFKRLENNIE